MRPSMLVPSRWLAATPCLAAAALCVLRREALCVVQAVTLRSLLAVQDALLTAVLWLSPLVVHSVVQEALLRWPVATAAVAVAVS